MPIFEYKCNKCQTDFEILVQNSDEKVKCAKCGNKNVTKQLSGFSASVKALSAKSCSVSECASCCPSGSCSHNH